MFINLKTTKFSFNFAYRNEFKVRGKNNIMIIGLTGRIASGKGEVVKFLENKGFDYSTISNAVREEAKKRGMEITRSNLQDLGNEIRQKEGAGGWIKKILENFDLNKNLIIDGIRNPGEIEELRKKKDFFLISIDAPKKIRFERVLKRAKPSDPNTWEGFLEIDNRDFGEKNPLGQQVGECMALSDFQIFNDSSVEELNKKIREVFDKIKC